MGDNRNASRENILLIHWHDLGRHLKLYDDNGADSPALEKLASQGFLFTNAYAAAPLCSPARGALMTGRYPHSNGIVGLAHHGWEYRDGVRTLPYLLGKAGWRSALIGMQHESATPARLGYDEFDVTDSDCDYVVDRAIAWLTDRSEEHSSEPFLLNTGFFEVHRPYPDSRYTPVDPVSIAVPNYLPDTPEVRGDLAAFHGSINVADAATGRLVEAVDELGFGENTWIVFFTDHGEAFPGAKSTLHSHGTGISFIVRPPAQRSVAPRVYDDLFSGVDLVPTVLDLLEQPIPADVEGVSHARAFQAPAGEVGTDRRDPIRGEVFTAKDFHDSFDPVRSIRTTDFSYIENYARRPVLDLPLDIADSASGRSVDVVPDQIREPVELYDLRVDPGEIRNVAGEPEYAHVQAELSARLTEFLEVSGDQIIPEHEGTRIADEFMRRYLDSLDERDLTVPRSPRGADRGLEGGDTVVVNRRA